MNLAAFLFDRSNMKDPYRGAPAFVCPNCKADKWETTPRRFVLTDTLGETEERPRLELWDCSDCGYTVAFMRRVLG